MYVIHVCACDYTVLKIELQNLHEICMTLAYQHYLTIPEVVEAFEVILPCCLCILAKMSVIPQGMYIARKVRQNEEKLKNQNEIWNLIPPKYSSKYMNSIWGMYNRYSVHNFKKNIDESVFAFGVQHETVGPKQSVEKNSAEFKGSLSSAKNLLSSPGFL